MRLTSPDRSSALTTAPRMAMPVTAPNSRLVFVADAAIPDRSAGTAPSTDEVTGTTPVPVPRPAHPSAAGRGVAGCLAGDDAEDQGGERTGAEHGASQIDPARLRVGALGQDHGRYDQRGQAEGHVEPENPPPAPRPDQCPAQDRAERERE